MVLGIRGIPNVQGGVETHAEQLYGRLAALGCQIDVIVRSPCVPKDQRTFGSIRLHRIWSPQWAGFEAFFHSVLGVLYAGVVRPDILHIHAVGPAIVTPLARLLGLRVVVTHHGPDYDRDKWGAFARWVLRTGECVGMRWSQSRIAISQVIADLIRTKHNCDANIIPNGVVPAELSTDSGYILRIGLEPRRYVLHVSRMVPEKRQLDLIKAFIKANPPGWKLALVGGLTDDSYSSKVQAAANSSDIVLTGYLNGERLQQMYSHAGFFVLPSSHEGLPIALLEALSYGLPVLASDIPANLEVDLDRASYFPLGDTDSLADSLTRLAQIPQDEDIRAARRRWVVESYDWNHVAAQTLAVYRRLLE